MRMSETGSALTEEQKRFLQYYFLPVVGKRGILKTPDNFRACRIDSDCIETTDFVEGKGLRVEWVKNLNEPRIESTTNLRVLKIPSGFKFEQLPNRGADLIKSLLVGHSLHPYILSDSAVAERLALSEPRLHLKPAQLQASVAALKALQEGVRKFLFVAPTGLGKTEVLIDVLRHRIVESEKPLHILVADQNLLTDQLLNQAEKLKRITPFQLIRWGKGNPSFSIPDLVSRVGNQPTVLVTTIHSLRSQLKLGDQESNYRSLRSIVATLAYDEVHHAGAEQAKRIIENLIDHPESAVFFYGTTATPTHRETTIQELFGYQAYWAYVDAELSSFERPIQTVVEQLALAIGQGELSPFEKIYFINPESITGDENTPLFVPISENRPQHEIDVQFYPQIISRLTPLFLKHQKGFVAVSNISEADALAKALQSAKIPGKSFAVYHSGLTQEEADETERAFREGRINFIVSVRCLDEGVDFPEMTLYVDLNRTLGPRQFLQRAGRILRLALGKEQVDMVTFMEVNEESLGDKLALLDAIFSGKLGPRHKKEASGQSTEKEIPNLVEADYWVELDKLRKQLRDFWIALPKRESYPVAAQNINSFVAEEHRLPIYDRHGEEKLYQQVFRLRNNEDFQQLLSEEARLLLDAYIEKLSLRSVETFITALDAFVAQYHRLPSNRTNELFERQLGMKLVFRLDRRKAERRTLFLSKVSEKTRSLVEERDKKHEELGPQFAAKLVNKFVANNHFLPRSKSKNSEERRIADRIRQHKANEAFVVNLSPEAIDLFDKRNSALEHRGPKVAAEAVNNFVEKYGHLPRNTKKDREEDAIYEKLNDYLDDSDFIAGLSARAAELLKIRQEELGKRGPVSFAKEVSQFVEEKGYLPRSKTERFEERLSDAIRRYKKNPDFLNALSAPAKELLELRMAKSHNLGERYADVAKKYNEFVETNGFAPSAKSSDTEERRLADNFRNHEDKPEFQALLSEKTKEVLSKAREIQIQRRSERAMRENAEELNGFVEKWKRLPRGGGSAPKDERNFYARIRKAIRSNNETFFNALSDQSKHLINQKSREK